MLLPKIEIVLALASFGESHAMLPVQPEGSLAC